MRRLEFELQRFAVTIEGTAGKDSINNTVSSAVICGYGGNDSIKNSGRYSTIYADAGNDKIYNYYSNYSYIDGGDGNDSIHGAGEYYVTIVGGAGKDSISGNYSSSNLSGGDGADYFSVKGNYYTTIDGGADNDTIIADFGKIFGGDGNDKITLASYARSNATIIGGAGNDSIYITSSESGNIYRYAEGDGNDVITGFSAKDTLEITDGAYSTIKSGNDIIVNVGSGSVKLKNAASIKLNIEGIVDGGLITLSAGNDTYRNTAENFTISGGDGKDTLENLAEKAILLGDKGADVLINSSYYSTVDGGDGNDKIYSQNGFRNLINGGAGNDSIYVEDSSSVWIHGGSGNDTVQNHGEFVSIYGEAGSDFICNYSGYNFISGGDGSDKISLVGDANYVTISGGKGSDSIYGDSLSGYLYQYAAGDGYDFIFGFKSNDTLQITSGDYSTATVGNDFVVSVGSGSIVLKNVFADKYTRIAIKNSSGDMEIFNDWKIRYGTSGSDTIYNAIGNVTIDGRAGSDSIYSSAKHTTILSGSGNDTVYNERGNYSFIEGGAGSDSIHGYKNDHVKISGGAGEDTISGRFWDSSISGGAGSDRISLRGYSNTISGGAGDDTIHGLNGNYYRRYQYAEGDGNDVIFGYNPSDTIFITGEYSTQKSGDDFVISVGSGSITLKDAAARTVNIRKNSSGGRIISGTDSNDLLRGTSGANTIDGGKGNDTLYGGDGADLFVFSGGKDTIMDYSSADSIKVEKLELEIDSVDYVSGNMVVSFNDGKDVLTIRNAYRTEVNFIDSDDFYFYTHGTGPGPEDTGSSVNGWQYNDTRISATSSAPDDLDLSAKDFYFYWLFANIKIVDASRATSGVNITGNDLGDSIRGGRGNDTIQGGACNDAVNLGAGDDIYIYTGGNDTIRDFGNGNDTIQIGEKISLGAVEESGEDILITTDKGAVTLSGGADKNIVVVDEFENILYSKNDSSPPDGWKFNTEKTLLTATLSSAGDIDLTQSYGSEVIKVNATKTSGGIEIIGNDLDNSIKGGIGADTISGGEGNDTLTGGNGADVFVYESGSDLITDYRAGVDKIKIASGSITGSSLSGSNVILTTGGGTLTVKNGRGKNLTVIDASGTETTRKYSNSGTSAMLFSDDNFISDEMNLDAITESKSVVTSFKNFAQEQIQIYQSSIIASAKSTTA